MSHEIEIVLQQVLGEDQSKGLKHLSKTFDLKCDISYCVAVPELGSLNGSTIKDLGDNEKVALTFVLDTLVSRTHTPRRGSEKPPTGFTWEELQGWFSQLNTLEAVASGPTSQSYQQKKRRYVLPRKGLEPPGAPATTTVHELLRRILAKASPDGVVDNIDVRPLMELLSRQAQASPNGSVNQPPSRASGPPPTSAPPTKSRGRDQETYPGPGQASSVPPTRTCGHFGSSSEVSNVHLPSSGRTRASDVPSHSGLAQGEQPSEGRRPPPAPVQPSPRPTSLIMPFQNTTTITRAVDNPPPLPPKNLLTTHCPGGPSFTANVPQSEPQHTNTASIQKHSFHWMDDQQSQGQNLTIIEIITLKFPESRDQALFTISRFRVSAWASFEAGLFLPSAVTGVSIESLSKQFRARSAFIDHLPPDVRANAIKKADGLFQRVAEDTVAAQRHSG